MTPGDGEVHVTIDHLVVSGLSAVESGALVRELRAGLTSVLSGRASATALAVPQGRSRGRDLGRVAAARVARAAGRA